MFFVATKKMKSFYESIKGKKMEPLQTLPQAGCGCNDKKPEKSSSKKPLSKGKYLTFGILGILSWYILYKQLLPFSNFFTYTLLGITPESHLGASIQFFVYDTPKVMLLLCLIVFIVGIIRTFFTPEKTRKVLAGKKEITGNVMASLLGIVTPFCSCSAIPLFLGFVQAGIPLGVTLSFLIAAPMVNEIALILLYGLLGWKVAALYMVSGISIAIICGWIMGKLKMEHLIEDWVQEMRTGQTLVFEQKLTWADRIDFGKDAVRDIVGKIWIYIVAGIAIGAAIHGYVPENMMATLMGKEAWWSVPAAVSLGIPMYSSAAGIVPVVEALLGKGAALGTVLAFMMSVIALSLPEMVILRKVLKPKLIATYIMVLGGGILFTGFLFNMVI